MNDWQQFFPTYSFKKEARDIALEEYKLAGKLLESEERIFDSLVKYIFVFGTVTSFFITVEYKHIINFLNINNFYISFALSILIFFLFLWITKNFSEKQRAIVFGKRKIVILRQMLGIDYGTQVLLFPRGELQGCTIPFNIKLKFNYLFSCIPVLCFLSIFLINFQAHQDYSISLYISLFFVFLLCIFYRQWILDTNETLVLIVLKLIFKIIGLKLEDNFEYILYRAKLARYEIKRMKIELQYLKQMVVAIEDKNFYKHKGVDYKALLRAFLSQCRKIPLIGNRFYCIQKLPYSGGSTITQQLFRSLFIKDTHKKIRRKIAEILFSRFWLNQVFRSKDEQLEIYLSVVRFSRGVYGIIEAIKHFYGTKKRKLTKAESFF